MKQRSKKSNKSFGLPFDKKLLIFSGALLVTLFVLVSQVQLPQNVKSRAQVLPNCDVNSTDMSVDSEEQGMLTKINEYRKSKGLGELKISHDLQRAATWLTFDMRAKNYLSHTDSLKRDLAKRVKDCGFVGQRSAENIAQLGPDMPDVFIGWQQSPPHNSNMLNPRFTHVGIAASGDFWTLDFGSEDENGDAATPSGTVPQPSSPPFGIIQPCPSCDDPVQNQPVLSPVETQPTDSPPVNVDQDTTTNPLDESSNSDTNNGANGGIIAAILGFFKALLEVLLALFKG